MSYTKKAFEELDIIDDFLMNAVAMDSEVEEIAEEFNEENSALNIYDIEPHNKDLQFIEIYSK